MTNFAEETWLSRRYAADNEALKAEITRLKKVLGDKAIRRYGVYVFITDKSIGVVIEYTRNQARTLININDPAEDWSTAECRRLGDAGTHRARIVAIQRGFGIPGA